MQKRYQVFVSSTFTDLVDERREVMQALLELDCLPAGMEMFPAADDDQWTLIKRVIDESDYYLVIVGGRYGSISEEGVSYTEREYDYAKEIGTPVLGFVHGSPGSIPVDRTDQDDRAREALAEFKDKVRSKPVREFTSPSELGSVVSRSLIRLIRDRPAEGWVRGRFAMTPEAQTEMAELKERLARAEVDRLHSVEDPNGQRLARGSDPVELDYAILDDYGNPEYSGYWIYTWDDLLRLLGPPMMDEANEDSLRRALERDLLDQVESDHEEHLTLPYGASARLMPASWNQVVVQFRALGIVDKGIKKRPVADSGRYWRLTSFGEDALMQLMALPSGVARAASRSGVDEEVEGGEATAVDRGSADEGLPEAT